MKLHLINIFQSLFYNLRLFFLYWTQGDNTITLSNSPGGRKQVSVLCRLWVWFGCIPFGDRARPLLGGSLHAAAVVVAPVAAVTQGTYYVARHRLTCFPWVNSFNSPNNPIKEVYIDVFTLKMRNLRSREIRSLAKVTQPLSRRARV